MCSGSLEPAKHCLISARSDGLQCHLQGRHVARTHHHRHPGTLAPNGPLHTSGRQHSLGFCKDLGISTTQTFPRNTRPRPPTVEP